MSTPEEILEQIDAHKHAAPLAGLVRTAALTAADERRTRLQDGLAELMSDAELSFDDGETPLGNALRGLEHPERATRACRQLLATLLARGVAQQPPVDADGFRRLAERLAWLAAHTGIDGLWALDATLGPQAEQVWRALADIIRGLDGGTRGIEERPSGLAAAAALASSDSSAAIAARQALLEELTDSRHRRLLALASRPDSADDAKAVGGDSSDSEPDLEPSVAVSPPGASTLRGELVPVPMRAIWLVLWAATGLLLVRLLLRGLARLILRLRKPAELSVIPDGLRLVSRVELVGRTIRQAETVIPRANLARAERQVRYPKLALYVGLIALAVGSYAGVSLFVDGARAGSPSLLALGAGVFGIGLLLDFLLSIILPGRRGRVRVIVVPRKGSAFAMSTPDPEGANATLQSLADSG